MNPEDHESWGMAIPWYPEDCTCEVQQTMKTASSDEELAFKQKQKDMATYTKKVRNFRLDIGCLLADLLMGNPL